MLFIVAWFLKNGLIQSNDFCHGVAFTLQRRPNQWLRWQLIAYACLWRSSSMKLIYCVGTARFTLRRRLPITKQTTQNTSRSQFTHYRSQWAGQQAADLSKIQEWLICRHIISSSSWFLANTTIPYTRPTTYRLPKNKSTKLETGNQYPLLQVFSSLPPVSPRRTDSGKSSEKIHLYDSRPQGSEHRLVKTKLRSLEDRWTRADLIEVYKIRGFIDCLIQHILRIQFTNKRTRGHPLKLHKNVYWQI